MPNDRIVSLLPSATEIICSLGLEKNLVGRSHECDYPASVKHLPVCTVANFPDNLGSAAIDLKIKEIMADALSVYTVKNETLIALAPDVIITQDQCEVCAVSLADVELALENHLYKKAHIISLRPNSVGDIFSDIGNIANQLNVAQAGADLLELLNERLEIIRHKLKFVESRPTVACIEWLDPLMISGNWIPELVNIAGGTPVLVSNGQRSAYVNWDEIRQQDPEVIIVMPCGFAIERTLKEIEGFMQLPGFTGMQAIKNNRLYIADGNQYFNRPGPRVVDSVEIIAELLRPKQFAFGYEGSGWIRFEL